MFDTLVLLAGDPASADSWDLKTFLDSFSGWMSYLMLLMGIIGTLTAGVMLIRKLTAPPSYYGVSWATIVVLIMVGGALTAGGVAMRRPTDTPPSSTDDEPDEAGESSPSPTPSTTETSAPTSEPTPQPTSPPTPAEPTDLTWLWITLGVTAAIAILVVGILLTVMLTRKLRRASRAEAERERLEEAKRKRLTEAWARWTDRHQAVKEKVLSAETDWDMIFSYPCLSDATVPQTRELHRAMQAIAHASDKMPMSLDETTDIASLPYPKLVLAAEEAWDAAFSFAKRTGQKLLPKEERKTIEQIVKLLRLAQDSGGSPSERDVAYSRAQKLIAGLRVFKAPERAMSMIAQEQRLMLEAPRESELTQARPAGQTDDEKKSPIIL